VYRRGNCGAQCIGAGGGISRRDIRPKNSAQNTSKTAHFTYQKLSYNDAGDLMCDFDLVRPGGAALEDNSRLKHRAFDALEAVEG